MFFNFSKKYMDDLYDINFQSNGKFCKIRIRYNVIHDLCTIPHLKYSLMLDKISKYIWTIWCSWNERIFSNFMSGPFDCIVRQLLMCILDYWLSIWVDYRCRFVGRILFSNFRTMRDTFGETTLHLLYMRSHNGDISML
jgi:hypothetical protein